MKRTNQEVLGDIGETLVKLRFEEMKCAWVPWGSKGVALDACVELVKRRIHTGLLVGVQVKHGASYAHETPTHHVVKVEKGHLAHWKASAMPVILTWVEPTTRQIFWTHVPPSLERATTVAIPKTSKLGTHSLGELLRLARDYSHFGRDLPRVKNPTGSLLRVAAIKGAARDFYDEWRSIGSVSPDPTLGRVAVTLRGWRHVTAPWRSQRDIVNKLELLPVARFVLETMPSFWCCRGLSEPKGSGVKRRRFFEQRVVVELGYRRDAVVSVITEKIDEGPLTFYSVFEHQVREERGAV